MIAPRTLLEDARQDLLSHKLLTWTELKWFARHSDPVWFEFRTYDLEQSRVGPAIPVIKDRYLLVFKQRVLVGKGSEFVSNITSRHGKLSAYLNLQVKKVIFRIWKKSGTAFVLFPEEPGDLFAGDSCLLAERGHFLGSVNVEAALELSKPADPQTVVVQNNALTSSPHYFNTFRIEEVLPIHHQRRRQAVKELSK